MTLYDIEHELLNKIRKLHKELKIMFFYIKEVNKNKSLIAIFLDKISIAIIINFTIIVISYTMTKDYLFTLCVFIQFFILFILITYQIKKNKYKCAIQKVNDDLARKKISNDLYNMNELEFKQYIKNILGKSKIMDLQMINQEFIDIVGRLSNNVVAVKCIKRETKYKINIDDIKRFIIELKNMNFQMGIIITNGYYSDDVKDIIKKIERHKKIYLVDFDFLIKILKVENEYPSKREIRSIILDMNMLNSNDKQKISRERIFSSNKALRFFCFGFITYFLGKTSSLKNYYSLVSYFLMVFGLISAGNYFLKFVNKILS